MESRSRAESAGRAAAGKGSAGGTSGQTAQHAYRGLPTTSPGQSVPGQVAETGYGAPIHYTPEGTFAANPEKHAVNQDKMKAYNSAVRDWNGDLVQNNVLGWALPLGLQNVAPSLKQPATYSGGTYHFGMNPAAAAGALGSLVGPGVGTLASLAMGKAYSMGGGKNVVFSGPPTPSSWSKFSGANTGTAAPAAPSGMSGRGEAQGMQIPGPVQAPTPGIFSQPQQQAQQPGQSPSIFTRPPAPTPQQYMVGGGKPYGVNLFGRMA